MYLYNIYIYYIIYVCVFHYIHPITKAIKSHIFIPLDRFDWIMQGP